MSKVLIWGIGTIAKRVIANGLNAEIIGFIQSDQNTEMHDGKKVFTINDLPQEYDFIIVANSFATEIYHTCIKNGVPIKKIIFLRSIKKQEGFTDINVIRELLGVKNFTEYCNEFGLKEHSFFQEDMQKYNNLNKRETFRIQEKYYFPILYEKYAEAGEISNYFFQDLWAARMIVRSGIKEHFDIGSRIDGFITHLLAADIDVTMIDVREFPNEVENLHTIVDDATTLRQIPDESIASMSALCSLEHFGLGRYGDPINPEGCFECFANIQKKMKKGGRLYISVPIGMERIEFNAHRVFFASTIVDNFSSMQLKEFSCVAERKIEYDVEIHKYDNDLHNGEHRYGLFLFEK